MKILITGGAGFIASHVADRCLKDGHQVVVVDDLSSGLRANLSPEATFYQRDIRNPEVRDIFRRERPDVLDHHAAQIDVRRSVSDPILDCRVNIEGTLNLMEAAREVGVKKIIFASTGGAIYGDGVKLPTSESEETNPCSPYGIAKLACEKYIRFYGQTYGIPYVVLRYANVYGPRQNPHGEAGVVAIFCNKILAGEMPVINGSGDQTRDYCFVTDVVDANARALAYDGCGIFNIGTSKEADVVTLCRELISVSGRNVTAAHGPAKPGEQARSVLDVSLADQKLGWSPQVSLNEGLDITWRSFCGQAISH